MVEIRESTRHPHGMHVTLIETNCALVRSPPINLFCLKVRATTKLVSSNHIYFLNLLMNNHRLIKSHAPHMHNSNIMGVQGKEFSAHITMMWTLNLPSPSMEKATHYCKVHKSSRTPVKRNKIDHPKLRAI